MTQRIPLDRNLRTSCPVAVKTRITRLETAAMDFAFKGAQDPEFHDEIEQTAQAARYSLEQAVLGCIAVAAREEREDVRARAAYHLSEIEGCLDEYEAMPCNSLLARLRQAVNRAKGTFT